MRILKEKSNNLIKILFSATAFAPALALVLTLMLCLTACGPAPGGTGGNQDSQGNTTTEPENGNTPGNGDYEPPVAAEHPYIIMSVDMVSQQILLKDRSSGRQLLYNYNLNTSFLDKYGGVLSIAEFLPGRVVSVDRLSSAGMISVMRLSSTTWELEGLRNYSIDPDRGIFAIGQTNYRIPDDILIFSDTYDSTLSAIGDNDVLRVCGLDKDIWAITVTTGHGTLHLINTSSFDGSLVCVGPVYTLVKGDMSIEVPEGEYMLTVANNGYGGSTPVNIVRDNSVTVDLEEVKKDGIKFCSLTLKSTVPGAEIRLDDSLVLADDVIQVSYGRHSLSVEAEGYESWSKYLFVNSEKATIVLELTKGDTATGGSSQTGGGTVVVDPDKDDDTDKEKDEESRREAELEYLTTIRDMISAITGNL